MCDIGVKFDSGRFRLRSVGVIIKNGKILMVHDKKRKYYYAIGGAVRVGEKTSDAAIREVFEESGLNVEIDRLILIQENFFEMEDGLHHEVSFYYLMKDIGLQEICGNRVLDFNEEGLEWLRISDLSNYKVYPQIYNVILKEIPNEIVHFVVDERSQSI